MMTRRRVVYPLFFVVLSLLILTPSIPKGHALVPQLFSQVKQNTCSTANCQTTANIAGSSEIIIAMINLGNGQSCSGTPFTFSDTFSTTFSMITCILTPTPNPSTAGSLIFYGSSTLVSSAGSDTITVTSNNCFAPASATGCNIEVLDFTAFTGFGANATFHQQGSASGANTLAMQTQPQSLVIGVASTYVDGITCGTQTIGSSQAVLDTFSCKNIGASGSVSAILTANQAPGGGGTDSEIVNWSGAAGNIGFHRENLELKGVASGSNLGFITQCYGNCGTPAVTLANTNSTHSTNFNSSLTLFYEFQSQVNGNVNNVTTNIAKTYTNGQQVSLALYTAVCNVGVQPFTAACPGQQRILQTMINPVKGPFLIAPQGLTVQSQQWVAIAITGLINGLDINDTNANVQLFNQSPSMPPVLALASSLGNSKMGLWAWITGVTAGPPPTVQQPSCGADFLCILIGAAVSLTPSNPFAGAIFLAFVWSIATTLGLIFMSGYLAKSFGQSITMPSGVFLMIWFGWFMFWPAIVGAIWFTVLVMIILILTFASFSGSLLKGGVGVGGQTA